MKKRFTDERIIGFLREAEAGVPLPGHVMAAILGIIGLYLLATEMAKRRFYRRQAP